MIKKQCVNKNKQMPESESEYLCGVSSRPNWGSRSKESESGRSMVEMLGVLAIMGVLAIGGIAGYRYAMDKYNANEILNEVRKRAVTASQQRILGRTIDLSEWSNTIQGHPVTTADNYNGDTSFFALTVSGIEQGVCDHVIKEKILFAVEEKVGEVVVGEDTTCAEGENAVTFAFANDLASGSVGGGDGGNGGEENPPEEFDPTAPENNMFCASDGSCYSCDAEQPDSDFYDDGNCEQYCSNRESVDGYCVLKDCDGFRSSAGGCYPCDTPEEVWVGYEGTCEEACRGSGYERVKNGEYCNLKSVCENGFQDGYGVCYPCDTPEGVWVGGSGPCEEKCPNRVENGSYCNLESVCENGFQTSTGRCYPCDTPEGVSVGSSGTCEEACRGSGYERVKNRGYCNLKSACENGFRDSYGRCYPCDTPEGVRVGSEGTCEEACRGSGYERVKNGSNYCILNVPCDGFQTSSGACYPCDTASAIDVGSDGTCSEACTDVKRFKKGSYCNLCPKNVASVTLNTQEMCEACGGQWSGSVCCDGDRCATTTTP